GEIDTIIVSTIMERWTFSGSTMDV
ncbi:hypothetical protein CCACVL1_00084, partial [Corchorus capsularis]